MNYVGGVARILETPRQKIFKKNNRTIPVTRLRAQFPGNRKSYLVNLIFWGNLGSDVKRYYKVNDYILIEGYLSVRKKKMSKLTNRIQKKVEISVFKVYPFILSENRGISKI